LIKKLQRKLNKDANFKELLVGSAVTFIFKIGGMLSGYLVIYFISKNIGAYGLGIYNLFNTILLLFSVILGLGFHMSILRFAGQFNRENHFGELKSLSKNILKLVIPVSILISIFIYFSAEYWINSLGKPVSYIFPLKILSIILPIFTLQQIFIEFLRGIKILKISELLRSMFTPSIILIGFLIFWGKNFNIIDILYLFSIATILGFILSIWMVEYKLKAYPKQENPLTIQELMKVSLPMMFNSIISATITLMPLLFLEHFSSVKEVGIYSLCVKIASIISIILVIMNTIIAPKIAELFWSKKMAELQKIIFQSVEIISLSSIFMAIILIFSSNYILAIFGNDFYGGRYILWVLILGQLISSISGSVSLFLNMSGYQKVLRNLNALVLVFCLVLNLIFTPFYGVKSVAIVSAIGTILMNILPAYIIYFKTGIKTFYNPIHRIVKIKKWLINA